MIRMTLDCVRLKQSGVIQSIFRNVGLKCFFSFTNLYFIYISQGSVKTHLRCKLSAECANEKIVKIGQ